jgi:antitoxin YefM
VLAYEPSSGASLIDALMPAGDARFRSTEAPPPALGLRREEVRVPALTAAMARATIVAMTTEPLRSVRDHLSELVDRVEREHERVVITRNGRDAAVLMSAVDLAGLEETLSVLSDSDALADIREADAAYAQDDVVRGVDAVRRLRS